jgi:hypothetical protein
MSLEDEFHKNNKHKYNKKSLVAKIEVTKKEDISNITNNINSERFNHLLILINNNNNLDLNEYSQQTVITNNHPAFNVDIDIEKNVFKLAIDHSMVGGSLLVKLLETIINSKERKFPETSIIKSIYYSGLNIYNIFKFTQLTSVCLNTSNNTNNTNNTSNNKESLYYYSRLYTIDKNSNIPRLSVAYYTIFNDALIALNKERIRIGIPIPFENNSYTNNNVGIIILEYQKNMSLFETHNLLKKISNLAYISNTYNLYSTNISKYIQFNNSLLREKIDIICSTFITNNNCLNGRFSLQPTISVIENAYMSVHIHLLGDKQRAEIYVNVTTHNINQKWPKVKYLKNPL